MTSGAPSTGIDTLRGELQALSHRTAALALSEERWALAILGNQDGIWDWDSQSGQVFFSDRWKSMLGYEGAEIGDQIDEWLTRIHPQDLDDVMQQFRRHLQSEAQAYECEHRMRHKDGHYLWVLARGQAQWDAAGAVQRMTGSFTDVTERRLAQDALRDQTEELNTILNLSPDGFVSFGRAGHVKYLSPAFTQMTGLDFAQLKGLDEADFWTALAGGEEQKTAPQPGLPRRLLELTRPTRRVLDVSQRLSPAATVSQILCFRDVTHETEVDRFKTEFLSTAAHELRTPLASIYGFSELLLTQPLNEANRSEFLNIIFTQSQQMSALLNELLDLSRIEARGGKDLALVRIDARTLVQQVTASLQLPTGRAMPVVEKPASALFLRVDAAKTQQAIANVLSNAYKYSPDGGIVQIRIEANQVAGDKPMIGICISDPGIGMQPEQTSRIFERFYRVDKSGKIPGTGLGMSIVKELVELQQGSVSVRSVPGQGTTVCLLLPADTGPIA
jgi:PAS domain S-box-containing protein